jgi:hypothetical protein
MRPLATLKLLTELELASDGDVALGIGFVEVIEQAASLADHLEEATA